MSFAAQIGHEVTANWGEPGNEVYCGATVLPRFLTGATTADIQLFADGTDAHTTPPQAYMNIPIVDGQPTATYFILAEDLDLLVVGGTRNVVIVTTVDGLPEIIADSSGFLLPETIPDSVEISSSKFPPFARACRWSSDPVDDDYTMCNVRYLSLMGSYMNPDYVTGAYTIESIWRDAGGSELIRVESVEQLADFQTRLRFGILHGVHAPADAVSVQLRLSVPKQAGGVFESFTDVLPITGQLT